MKKICKFLLFVTVIAVFASCEKDSNYSKSIVGEWQQTSDIIYQDGKKIQEHTLDYTHDSEEDVVWSFSTGGEWQAILAYHYPSKVVVGKANYSVQGRELKFTIESQSQSMTIEKLTSSDLVVSYMEGDNKKIENYFKKIK